MPTDDDFFDDEQHEASRLKVEAYGKYLKPFAYKLLSWNRKLFIVDGFAGAGRYSPDGSGVQALGSPMVAAQFARQYNIDNHAQNREIRLINVEKKPEFYARLCHNLAGFGNVCLNLKGTYEANLERILKEIGKHPALFFLDSFGMRATDIRLIDEILKRREGCITEFLIHFSDRSLVRIAGNLHANTVREVDLRAATTKLNNTDALLGTPWWRGCFTNPEHQTAESQCDAAAAIYMAQLEKRGIQYVNEMRMRDHFDDPPRYRLIFATRSAHGTYLMNDNAARHEAELFEARYEGTFDLEWQRGQRANERAALRDEIYRWGLARGTATPLDIYMHFTPEYFGCWRISDYDWCLRELITSAGIKRKTSKGIKPKEKLVFVEPDQGSLFDAL